MKKLWYYIQLLDGVWSVPLAFAAFWLVGVVLQSLYGYDAGVYDVSFIQPLFLAAAVVIGATNVALLGMYFTFRGLYRYLYGQNKEVRDGTDTKTIRVNYSKNDWVNLKIWQRYIIAFLVFFYFCTAVVVVYLHLV